MDDVGGAGFDSLASLCDVDGLAALVPATGRTHGVRYLHGATTGAGAPTDFADFPVAGPTAAGLRLGLLLLWDGHCSTLFVSACSVFVGTSVPAVVCFVKRQARKARPSMISCHCGARTGPVVSVGAAGDAQPRAPLSTEWGQRQVQKNSLPSHQFEIDRILAYRIGVSLHRMFRIHLLKTRRGLPIYRVETASTRGNPGHRGGAFHQHAVVHRLDTHVDGQGRAGRNHRFGDHQFFDRTAEMLITAHSWTVEEIGDRDNKRLHPSMFAPPAPTRSEVCSQVGLRL